LRALAIGLAVGLVALVLAAVGAATLIASIPAAPFPERGEARIAHATLVEPGVRRRVDRTLVVRGGRIASIEPSGHGERAGPWDGLFVMPGLVDLHVHVPPAALPAELRATLLLFLAHGVTSVRDAGAPWAWGLGVRSRVEAGALAGPRVFSCGPLIVGRESWPGATVLTEPSEVGRVIERLRGQRVDCVKLLDSVSPDVASAIWDAAHRAGLRVIGHVPSTSEGLIVDEVQHLTGLEAALRTRHPAALAKAAADSLAAHAAHTPTLVVLERFARASEGQPSCDASCGFLPRYFPTVLWDPERIPALGAMVSDLGFSPRERCESAKRVVRALADGGVRILAGTDSPTFYNVPGASLHEEIALLHEAGLSAEEALATATTWAAEALGVEGLGRIEPGAPADLVLLRSDPIESIETGRSLDIAAVIVRGELYAPAELDLVLREYEQFFADSAYATAAEALARAVFPGVDRE
jgi:imidazolonepropionase-like amidohydrolase